MAGEKVLVVDDTGFNRLLVEKCLAGMGFEIELADSGEEAIKLLSRNRFSLVITDLMMPGMDGVQLFRSVRDGNYKDDDGAIPVPPFVLCTAFHDKEALEEAIKEGFKDVILKPVDKDRLRESVKNVLSAAGEEMQVKVGETEAVVLKTLSEMLGASPQEILKVLLDELAVCEFGDDLKSLEEFQEFVHGKLTS